MSPGVHLSVVKPVLPRLMTESRSCYLIMRQLFGNCAGPFLNLNIPSLKYFFFFHFLQKSFKDILLLKSFNSLLFIRSNATFSMIYLSFCADNVFSLIFYHLNCSAGFVTMRVSWAKLSSGIGWVELSYPKI